jgi:hypothetical protein
VITSNERVCKGCEHMIPWDWVFCAWCGFENDAPEKQPDEASGYEELRKRATRLIVAMRRDRWEGHDHGYANDLAELLNVGSPMEPPPTQKHYPEEWGPSDARKLSCVCGNPDPGHMNQSTVKASGEPPPPVRSWDPDVI